MAPASVIRVKPGADLANASAGATWADATNLQRALGLAVTGDEIWVASGVYYPDEGEGQTDDSRSAVFQVRNAIKLFGGFAGTETALAERDLAAAAPSVLSGDIEQDDLSGGDSITSATSSIRGENSPNIVLAVSAGAWTLDGFTITGGGDFRGTEGGVENIRSRGR